MSANLDGHAASHLAHRREEREAAISQLNCLVGDGDAVGFDDSLCEGFGGGKVKEGEEDLIRANEGYFLRLRFFDFDDEVGLSKDSFRSVENFRSGLGVGWVREARSKASVSFDDDSVS